jgi:hypothetical protein
MWVEARIEHKRILALIESGSMHQKDCKTQVQAIVSNKIICKTEVDPQGMINNQVKSLLLCKKLNGLVSVFPLRSGAIE